MVQEEDIRKKKDAAKKERRVVIDLITKTAKDATNDIVDVYEEARLADDRKAVATANVAVTAASPVSTDYSTQTNDNLSLELTDNPMLKGVLQRPEFRAAAVLRPHNESATPIVVSKHQRIQDIELSDVPDTGESAVRHLLYEATLPFLKVNACRCTSLGLVS